MSDTSQPKPPEDPDKGSGVCAPGEGKDENKTESSPSQPAKGS
jgi:hypothetical protein